MKKYKLIKSYPGSPKLGIEVNYSENNKIYNYNGGDFYSELPKHQVENLPEFWQEIIEKDYEILSFKSDTDLFTLKNGNVYITNSEKLNSWRTASWILKERPNWVIYSVKRLSDGEIFKVGDSIDAKSVFIEKFNRNIKEFRFIDNKLRIFDNIGWFKLEHLNHYKKPLFTTEDGVDMFENDRFYWVREDFISGNNIIYYDINYNTPTKKFSTKEAAEKYILMNKPCLSLKDVFRVYPEYKRKEPKDERTNHAKVLVKLAKSKL